MRVIRLNYELSSEDIEGSQERPEEAEKSNLRTLS